MKPTFIFFSVLILITGINPISMASNNPLLNQKLEYINTDLREAIRDLAELGGFRVILDRQVQGEVTLTLMSGVTAKEAITTVARGYGYSSRWLSASTVMVGTTSFINGNFAARSTRIYTLKFADPVSTAEALQTIVPLDRIQINRQTKELTITADSAEHQNISELINRLDYKTSSIILEIRIEEIAEPLWRKLQLEADWQTTEMGALVLNEQQLKLLQDSSERLVLGKPELICYNNQEARVLIGDYLPSGSEPKNGAGFKIQAEDLETGTRLMLTPSLATDSKLSLKINAAVKNVVNNKPNLIRSIQSRVGLNSDQTILLNGLLQRSEYLEIQKKAAAFQFPILESLYAKGSSSSFNQPTRIVALITPYLTDGGAPAPSPKSEMSSEPASGLNNQSITPQGTVEATPAVEDNSRGTVGPLIKEEPPVKPEEARPETIYEAIVIPESQPEKELPLTVTPHQTSGLYDVRYTVKQGDTPFNIAKKFGVELSAILTKNKLTDLDKIKVDAVLVIPVPVERIYVVKSKETLWRIAKRYGITLEALKDLNGIADETKVQEGQKLVLPISNRNVVNPQF